MAYFGVQIPRLTVPSGIPQFLPADNNVEMLLQATDLLSDFSTVSGPTQTNQIAESNVTVFHPCQGGCNNGTSSNTGAACESEGFASGSCINGVSFPGFLLDVSTPAGSLIAASTPLNVYAEPDEDADPFTTIYLRWERPQWEGLPGPVTGRHALLPSPT